MKLQAVSRECTLLKVVATFSIISLVLLSMSTQDWVNPLVLKHVYNINNSTNSTNERLHTPVSTCVPKQQIVYLKTHKTGSTTLARIVEQYAFDHKLDVVRKIAEGGSIHYGNRHFNNKSHQRFLPPRGVKREDYKNYKYDVFTLHAVFDRPVYESFMKGRPFFMTIIRNPVKQFESAFDFFGVGTVVKGSTSKDEKLKKFISNPNLYWPKVKGNKRKYGHNDQLCDLGVDHSRFSNQTFRNNALKKLDNEIDLVLINDFYDESLIIMKKKLCWRFEDILYIPRNQRISRAVITDGISKKIEKWNSADMELYKYFVNKLEGHILEYGPDFNADVAAFREMTGFLYELCVDSEGIAKGKKIVYNITKNITSSRCTLQNSTDVCSFSGGYQLNGNIRQICKQVTSGPKELNIDIRKMMKS